MLDLRIWVVTISSK